MKRELKDQGLPPWLEWSARSAKFDLSDALKTWESFKERDGGASSHWQHVFHLAKAEGWREEGARRKA